MSEVTQTKKDKYNMYSLTSDFYTKQREINLQFIIPENLDNKENPKRDIHVST